MIVIKRTGLYYKVYYNGEMSDPELSRVLWSNKLRFVADLGKSLSFDHCVLAEQL